MFKKFLAAMILAVTAFTFTACSDDSDSGAEKATKSVESKVSSDKPKIGPEKAIEDFAMVQFYGTTGNDEEAAASTGMKPDEIDKYFKKVVKECADDLKEEYLLNDETATELAVYYLAKCADSSNLTVKLKKDDDVNPVVTVSFAPVDHDAIVKKMRSNAEFVDLMGTIEENRNDPKAKKDLENNAEYQAIILQGLEEEIFDEIPVKATKSVDMECEIAKGYDGKNYWMPIDTDELSKIAQ